MRILVWILTVVFLICWVGSFVIWAYGDHDRRFMIMGFGWQIVCLSTAAFLDE